MRTDVALANVQVGSEWILEVDPFLNQIVPRAATVERVAGGFGFTEGPIWIPEGYLLFSDIPNNTIYRWTPSGEVSVFRRPSGFEGTGAPAGALVGSNGLTLDRQGRLLICEHGNRRVSRLELDGSVTTLATRCDGKRLNSPNDIDCRRDGTIYFTDPPYGLLLEDDDPEKELGFNGVYRISDGTVRLLHSGLTRPNGLAFSPDEAVLYVGNSDERRKTWMRFECKPDGTLGDGAVFYDVTEQQEGGLPDGMKVDQMGNLYCTGPGGVWIFSPDGRHLGTIKTPEIPANCNWGDADGKTLYITARTSVYRIRLQIPGVHPCRQATSEAGGLYPQLTREVL